MNHEVDPFMMADILKYEEIVRPRLVYSSELQKRWRILVAIFCGFFAISAIMFIMDIKRASICILCDTKMQNEEQISISELLANNRYFMLCIFFLLPLLVFLDAHKKVFLKRNVLNMARKTIQETYPNCTINDEGKVCVLED